jgi:hypothetical protein
MYLIFLSVTLQISYIRKNCHKIQLNTDVNVFIFNFKLLWYKTFAFRITAGVVHLHHRAEVSSSIRIFQIYRINLITILTFSSLKTQF